VVAEPKAAVAEWCTCLSRRFEALRDHLATRPLAMPSARVFTRPDGSELRAHHVHTAWQTARAKAGLANAHVHDLRHAGLTLATQSGATLAEVMRACRAQHPARRDDLPACGRGP
jgi:integrase